MRSDLGKLLKPVSFYLKNGQRENEKYLKPNSHYLDARDEEAILICLRKFSPAQLLQKPIAKEVEKYIVLAIESADKAIKEYRDSDIRRDTFLDVAIPRHIPVCKKCNQQMTIENKWLVSYLPPHYVMFGFKCETCGTDDVSYFGDENRFSEMRCPECNNFHESKRTMINGKWEDYACAHCGYVAPLVDYTEDLKKSKKESEQTLSKFRHILHTESINKKLENNLTSSGPHLEINLLNKQWLRIEQL